MARLMTALQERADIEQPQSDTFQTIWRACSCMAGTGEGSVHVAQAAGIQGKDGVFHDGGRDFHSTCTFSNAVDPVINSL